MSDDIFHDAKDAADKLMKDSDKSGSVLDKDRAGLTPDQALVRLRDGNARYVAGEIPARDHAAGRVERAASQAPFAAILGCADSRVAPELAFDLKPGDLFVCRLAGNVVNADVLASLEYAVAFLGTSLVVVLGHSGCGAVDAAIKVADKNEILPGNLDQLAVSILPAVARAQAEDGGALLDRAIAQNARLSALRLASRSAALSDAIKDGQLRIVAAVYDIATGQVQFLDD
ncbi:carbonic anhydrase [Paracoccus sp. (in: a-proteobacteria)]|uniref:carbonic anhydrase n=1 Tax=Paracoccus sp. TaxID=267 RepID=UPI0026DFE69C|nr:carbonic anhydrase [Paracoccus sp. (in: a-proteobacteria)]MDO5646918.1 carbonic anhydrase [Paracoccus sp. (in: a-proteobacteria)]